MTCPNHAACWDDDCRTSGACQEVPQVDGDDQPLHLTGEITEITDGPHPPNLPPASDEERWSDG